ncbi:UvrD/REP type DNA helicase [Exidia glandulosa HHB12029]|uniref:DNA 3'-5' helicase n=1 Tax=Exidia glandulosa HHB12029 TaxID=1314781 RepID=A0A165GQT0_EXIGL|nr:UvrD/REP type DNA helicase [Exidia glandulosa HHB12029]
MALAQDYLATLNQAQHRAVTHPPHVPLQILAGPGSGKTHVLTCRIAHLVGARNIAPSRIVAVTFTNKAANEMRERLVKLVGPVNTAKLLMGTFHALCAKFLRQYGEAIGLNKNFTICDADESKKIVNKLIKTHADYLQSYDFEVTDRQVASLISKAKSKGLSPEQVAVVGVKDTLRPPAGEPPNPHHVALSMLYSEYQAALKANKSLDFDDLLAYGVKLLDAVPRIAEFCEHVLVDEFQDTNVQQYALMTRLASHHKCVSIVGDPDQSIYGWRAAEIENLAKMVRDFTSVEQVLLEQNYRSTQSILRTSIAIMAEDKNRIPKSLYSAHHEGTVPHLRQCRNERDEADFVAQQIKMIVAQTGGMLKYTDFAILLRTSAYSRALESSLQREGVPHRVLKGHKFFERMEVKDLLSYLQLVDNPNFAPAFARAINTPPRGIGDKTITELMAVASSRKCSAVEVVEGIFGGRFPDIKPPCKRKLGSFITVFRRLRTDAQSGAAPDALLKTLVEVLEYEAHLKKTQEDWESRMENVQELVSFAGQTRAADVDVPLPDLGQDQDNGQQYVARRTICRATNTTAGKRR